MTIRQAIRDFLDSQEGPMWGVEIIAAVRAKGAKCKPSTLVEMASEGLLAVHEEPGKPAAYSISRRPRRRMEAQEKAAALRAKYAKRDARRQAERRAQGIQPRPKRNHIVLASSHATVGGESVAEFLARGGSIERLPGIQKSSTYPQRRPSWSANNRSVSA